jgi:hypothetical protein
MKIKTDFVTNSSSTSFIITNTSNKKLTLVDLIKENPQIIADYVRDYTWSDERKHLFTQEKLLISAEANNITFKPGESKTCVFGDEDGTLVGGVLDYMLRYYGSSKNFKWRLDKYLR